MDGEKMNGKTLKVAEYNLEFGKSDRFVNVFGCFKYKPNNNIYVIYTDVDTKYPIIYYGSAHVKDNNILSMQCKDISEQELIKEYIYKVTNNETIKNFEMISLDNIETIELVGSNKIEVKPEIINSLVDIIIPKKEEKEIIKKTTNTNNSKRRNSKTLLLLLLFILIFALVGLIYIKSLNSNNTVSKKIICQKEYKHNELKANVSEENTYNFNNKDVLETINTKMIYKFKEQDYQRFINEGMYYKYLPDDEKLGGYKQDDENYTFEIIINDTVSTSYTKPTMYEEVLSYYKSERYNCIEKIEG